VQDSGFKGLGFKEQDLRSKVLGYRVKGSGLGLSV